MCKIKDLDRNEVYDLTEIKKDSAKFDLLKEWLKENDRDWSENFINALKSAKYIKYNYPKNEWIYGSITSTPTKCALTLFELDITDYQVDCSELSEVEINNLADIVKNNRYEIWENWHALHLTHVHKFLNYHNNHSSFGVFKIDLEKTTITYDKFIELFGEKPIEQSVKELADAFEEKPTQYQIGIDTFTRAEANMTREEILACVRFNIDKYTWRKKDQDKQDLEKIISYAQWGLKQLK